MANLAQQINNCDDGNNAHNQLQLSHVSQTCINALTVTNKNELLLVLDGTCQEIEFTMLIDCSINEKPGSTITAKKVELQFTTVNGGPTLAIAKHNGNVLGTLNNSIELNITENVQLNYEPNSYDSPIKVHYAPTNNNNAAQSFTITYNNLTGTAAEIHFSFALVGNYCGEMSFDNLQYSIDGGTYQPLTAINKVTLTPNGNIKIKAEMEMMDQCISACVTPVVGEFKWWCGAYNAPTDYCLSCIETIKSELDFEQDDKPHIKVERIEPQGLTNLYDEFDYTCFNDLSDVRYHKFKFTNDGNCELAGVEDLLFWNGSPQKNAMSVIDATSVVVTKDAGCGSLCTIDPSSKPLNTNQFCAALVSNNTLNFAQTEIQNLNIGASFTLEFKTLRCSEEADNDLLNNPKFFNHWEIQNRTKRGCDNNFQPPNNDIAKSAVVNLEHNINYANIHQSLNHYPTRTALQIPPSLIPAPQFGEVDDLVIECNGMQAQGQHSNAIVLDVSNLANGAYKIKITGITGTSLIKNFVVCK